VRICGDGRGKAQVGVLGKGVVGHGSEDAGFGRCWTELLRRKCDCRGLLMAAVSDRWVPWLGAESRAEAPW
jgi:hypothetical protein